MKKPENPIEREQKLEREMTAPLNESYQSIKKNDEPKKKSSQ
ncbi:MULTISPECIES: hypothetical protein [Halobacillus]|uniref:Uncharacterized protein n=1 Tax=Halobacillus halophilus (strain ATCC 35676 / DSM 2266 / JCM 20832 / KCTC 3685 / LMG 17431 / NBRC 102448 / NCIMB 2269) TaxID=866895 RepID=I0JPQ9_HALH3|nr:hypothetical protein [Halobacillus halophilus]CCG46129.1 hypothetical protein HBHAL_3784 [Halobacillus halophilus DSM 2266]